MHGLMHGTCSKLILGFIFICLLTCPTARVLQSSSSVFVRPSWYLNVFSLGNNQTKFMVRSLVLIVKSSFLSAARIKPQVACQRRRRLSVGFEHNAS